MSAPATETPAVPEWAERVTNALQDASRHGRGAGRLTDGEQQLLDYLFLSVRQRAGMLSDQDGRSRLPWADVIAATWRTAVTSIEAEQARLRAED